MLRLVYMKNNTDSFIKILVSFSKIKTSNSYFTNYCSVVGHVILVVITRIIVLVTYLLSQVTATHLKIRASVDILHGFNYTIGYHDSRYSKDY